MSKWLLRGWCLVGLHDWVYRFDPYPPPFGRVQATERECLRCHQEQVWQEMAA